MADQNELRTLWDSLHTRIYPVMDEEGRNMANAQIRQLFDPARLFELGDRYGNEPQWLYVDDVDGYTIVDNTTGHRLADDEAVNIAAFREWNNR